MIVTANDIKNQVAAAAQCAGLDIWINETLRAMFLRNLGKPVHIDQKNVRWPSIHFEAAMTSRGFHVVFQCEDRPCASPYYVISL